MTTGTHASGGTGLARRAVRLLLARGLVLPADVHRYGLTARDVSASNGVVLVELGSGRGFAVKSLAATHEPGQGEPAREVALYRAASRLPAFEGVAPALVLHDPDEELLVLEGLLAARRMDHHGTRDVHDPGSAGAFGAALGTWHRVSDGLDPLVPSRPWVLDLVGAGRPPVIDRSPALGALVDELLDDDAHVAALDRVRAAWTDDVVVHGDVRFSNVLLRPLGSAVLVDWEYAGRGDARWDVAGAVQEYLSAGEPYRGEAVTAFLRAYEAARGLPVDDDGLAPFVAARLLVRALQLVSWLDEPAAEVRRHRELAREVAA